MVGRFASNIANNANQPTCALNWPVWAAAAAADAVAAAAAAAADADGVCAARICVCAAPRRHTMGTAQK